MEKNANLKTHLEELIQLSETEFKYISSHFHFKTLKKNQSLIQVDDSVEHTYFVKKGLLKAVYTDENGKEHILQFAMENWWITDYQSYFTKTKAILAVICLENVELLALSYNDREKLCREFHSLDFFFRKKANSGYLALQKRMLMFLVYDTKSRYELLLSQYPSLYQRVSKSIIAAYLGVSRETLSRLDKKKVL